MSLHIHRLSLIELGVPMAETNPDFRSWNPKKIEDATLQNLQQMLRVSDSKSRIRLIGPNTPIDEAGIDAVILSGNEFITIQVKASLCGCEAHLHKMAKKLKIPIPRLPAVFAEKKHMLIRADTPENAKSCFDAQFARILNNGHI